MRILPAYAIVWLLVVFAWVGNYLVRIGFSAVLPAVMRELDLSYTSAGALATVFFSAYAVMQFPAGLLGDRFGRRRVLLAGLVLGALASLATSAAASFAALVAARLLTGIAQGCLFSNDRPIVAAVTPPEKIALGQSISFLGPGLGIALGLLLGGVLGELMPWRSVFVVFALPPLVAALLIARLVPAPAQLAARPPLAATLRRVLVERDLWLVALAGMAMMYVQYVLATWAPLLFMDVGVKEIGRAGFYSSLQGVAAVAGLLAGGWLGDRARRSGLTLKAVMLASTLGAAAAAAALALVLGAWRSPAPLAVALLLASGCAWSVWGPSFALLGEMFRPEEQGTAFGFYNAICVLGAVVGPVLTGWIRDFAGSFAAACVLAAVVALAGSVAAIATRPAFRLAASSPRARSPLAAVEPRGYNRR